VVLSDLPQICQAGRNVVPVRRGLPAKRFPLSAGASALGRLPSFDVHPMARVTKSHCAGFYPRPAKSARTPPFRWVPQSGPSSHVVPPGAILMQCQSSFPKVISSLRRRAVVLIFATTPSSRTFLCSFLGSFSPEKFPLWPVDSSFFPWEGDQGYLPWRWLPPRYF